MSEEGATGKKRVKRGGKPKPPTRRLNFFSRTRARFRSGADRVLGNDLVWSGVFVTVMLSLLGSQRCARDIREFQVGEAAPYDIKATYNIDVVDQAESEERWRQAREEIHDVYRHDGNRRAVLAADVAEIFEHGRRVMEEASLSGVEPPEDVVARELAGRVPDEVLPVLASRRFDVGLEREITGVLQEVMSVRIVSNKASLEREDSIQLLHTSGDPPEKLDSYEGFLDISAARQMLSERLLKRLPLAAEEAAVVTGFAETFIETNVQLDSEETSRRREEAVRAVPPVVVRVARGDLLIRQGEPITEDALQRLKNASTPASGGFGPREVIGYLALIALLAFFIWRYSAFHQRAFTKLRHLHALIVLMTCSMLLLAQGVLWLAGAAVDNLAPPFDRLELYTYLIPLGAGSILVALLANGRIATVYAGFVAILFGWIHGGDFYRALWAALVQLSGVYAISSYRERTALLRAGLVVGGAGLVAALAIRTIRGELEPLGDTFYGAGLAFVGGAVGVGLLISFALPLLERLFNVLTDIRLLELSSAENLLPSQLAVKAPGSYNHSLVVGTLAEEGAKAIGGNALFCRVAAIYHDIGKINHPEYYVENQRGTNPHDRLSPSMSALIIASHVKDGIKMAREAGLPPQIIDIIPQHHGTKLMSFFYEKAKSGADPSMGPVKEEEFRYPGPKPQTREAAIFMLADAVEAAARTIDDPTANRLREMIRKITNAIVLDTQFDQCDLTFRDLDKIQEAFLKLLVGMYHHRVDYPGFDFGNSRSKAKGTADSGDEKVEKGT